jgi:asparagine synthase (glutamine-hydrolysing)
MSGIYGVVRFDGQPIHQDFVAMQSNLAHWGSDGHTHWLDETVAFGQALLKTTPEASFEQLPRLVCGGTAVLTAAARLDNRTELCQDLGLDLSQRAITADGTLVALAFEKWGQACVHRLLGDWAFAVWNKHQQSLFLARDHFGNTGLHFCLWQDGFAFSSGIEGILGLKDVQPKIKQQRIVDLLTLNISDGSSTYYENIFRLETAHTVTLQNQKLHFERYWKLEQTPPLKLRSDAEYVEAFLSIYKTAVHDRMRSSRPIATTLSAGLDSGAVTAIAAKVMRERGQELTAFTSVPIYPTFDLVQSGIANEWDLAHQSAEFIGNIKHIPLPANHWTPLSAVRQATKILHEPEFAVGNSYWIQALLQELRQQDFGVLLTGQCGNLAASWEGGTYRTWSALRQGQLGLAFGQLQSGAIQRRSWTRAVLGEVAKPAFLSLQAHWQQKTGALPKPYWIKQSVISPILVHQLKLLEKNKNTFSVSEQPFLFSVKQQLTQVIPSITQLGATWHRMGASYGLEVRDPTMDKRLLEFCFAIPLGQFSGAGHDRWLMRRAVQGLLPPVVQWGVKRGQQGKDIGQRLLASREEVEELLERLMNSSQSATYLNLHKVKNAWIRLQQEQHNPAQEDGMMFLAALGLGLFLENIEL